MLSGYGWVAMAKCWLSGITVATSHAVNGGGTSPRFNVNAPAIFETTPGTSNDAICNALLIAVGKSIVND